VNEDMVDGWWAESILRSPETALVGAAICEDKRGNGVGLIMVWSRD
jgi:hypothetical protein